MSRSRSDDGQRTKYFIIQMLSSTNTIAMLVLWKVTVDAYGCKTIFYIVYLTQFA